MGPERVDRRSTADDQAGLRSAEQLVAAEQDEVGAGFDAVLRSRFVGQAELAGVEQTAAADIIDQHDSRVIGDGAEFGQRRLLGETHDAEVG